MEKTKKLLSSPFFRFFLVQLLNKEGNRRENSEKENGINCKDGFISTAGQNVSTTQICFAR